MPGVHKKINPTGNKRGLVSVLAGAPAGYLSRYP
jgi:hypothetical protein